MKGPDLAKSLVGVLTRCRKNKVSLVADVKAMFHQIKVDPGDQNVLRFLWWNKGDLYKDSKVCKMVVHPFGATSSTSCANFCLKQTAREFGHLYPSMVSGAVLHNFYVDECLVSVSTVKEAVTMQQKLTKLLARGRFHLTKWISNNDKVLESISELERSNLGQFMLDNGVKENVLGTQWHIKGDYKKPFTRRGLLSMTASVYDPLGFVAPVILEAKLLLKDLCKQKASWDSVISEEVRVRWSRWLEELPYFSQLRISRCFTQVTAASCEIHCFANASLFAYDACSYLHIINTKNFVHCSFLLGKSRLAPIKSVSTPKLELTAAVLALRLSCLWKAELDLPVVLIFWTDSTAVLNCIKNNTKRFSVFVANRLAIIKQNTELDCWRHVPSNLNPADLASRGIRANFNEMKKWLEEPEFLTKPRTECPINMLSNLTPTEEDLVTLMTEVEGILKFQPLVPLMLHDSEEEPLTPNHLLLLRGNPNLPPGTFETNRCYTRWRWAQVQFLANQFWRR